MRDMLETDTGMEPERYELREDPRYRFALGRRAFFGVAGAGLVITTMQRGSAQQRQDAEPTVAARLHIAEDGRITVMTSKVEVGQDSRTQLTQAAAEELRVPVEQITLVMADTARTPDDGGTAGSRTTPATVPAVRRGAAAAREILVGHAQKEWGVERASLQVASGVVKDPVSGKTLSYADLARSAEVAAAFEHAIPRDITLAAVSDWKVLGTSTPKIGRREIVTGAHKFPSDITRPNMLYGKILRPPCYGATLTAIDLSVAEKMPGVTAVRDGNFVGCTASTSFQAQQAVDALQKTTSWNRPPHPSSKELFSYLKQHAVSAGSGGQSPRVRERGTLEEGMTAAKKVVSASYEVAYIQHAPMEPRAAVAEWQDGLLTVWTGTQQPARVQRELTEAFRIPQERVRVIVPDTGGAFGGKHTGDAAVEAARLAKAAGRPVSLRWTREEEFTWAYFRPAALIETKAGLAADGKLLAWEFTNFNSGASAIESPYEIAHARETFRYCESPLREGSYRVLAATANNFARESFMDELAAVAGTDPLDYRLAHLRNERLRAVLEAAAARFRWRERRKQRRSSRGIGVACGTEKGSYVAACVAVEADKGRGSLRVLEICEAYECGAIQNPSNLRAQVEGCIIMTLGGALTEEIRFEDGRILNGRFSQYQVPRFKDVPAIEMVLLNPTAIPSVGAGETPMIAVPPAIGNAVFDACGVRLRSMPLRGEALRQA